MRLPDPKTQSYPADDAHVAQAAEVLRAGGLVAFPTETVYGLGADATQGEAVARIYAAKGRPSFNPLISHVPDLSTAQRYGQFPEPALALARAFWPGPLTLVVPARDNCAISDLARAGLPSVALRVPAHPVARALILAAGRPLAAPSANRSGHVSPTTATHVAEDLQGRIEMILDGGACPVGVESTIVSCLEGPVRLLRPGGVSREAIEAVLGAPLQGLPDEAEARPLAPGLLASHYAPRAKVRLGATCALPGEAVLDFGGQITVVAGARIDLSPSGDLVEAAAALFGALRHLDATGAACIAVAGVPESGLGEAINDRLRRSAVGR